MHRSNLTLAMRFVGVPLTGLLVCPAARADVLIYATQPQ
jgi:hypothetical protein